MDKIVFTGNGWVELNSTMPLFAEVESATNERLLFQKKEKILIFNNMRIKKMEANYVFYIGMIDLSTFILLKFEDVKRIVLLKENSREETFWHNEDIYKKENSTLCGNKFLGEYLVISNPEDLAFGEILEKKCENCFFRPREEKPKTCNIITGKGNMRPRTLFRRRKKEIMPQKIDGKEIAQYCPYFTHWDAK